MLSLSLAIFLGIIKYRASPDLSFSVFYLIPIFLSTWFVGRWAGDLIASACAVVWFIAELLSKHPDANPITPYWNVTVNLAFFLAFTYLLVMLKSSLDHERELARTDTLTGLDNRRSFLEVAHLEMSRARRYKHPFTLAYLDLDHFKILNDRWGHAAGDTFLKRIGAIFQSNLRTPDIVARLGGDEFALLLPETNYRSSSSTMLRIQKLIMEEASHSAPEITASVGMVTCENPDKVSKKVEDILQMADRLMYEAKQAGKNAIRHEKLII